MSQKKLKHIASERNELRAAFIARMAQYDATEIGFMTLDGIVAYTAVEGSMTKELLLEWLEFTVLLKCSAYLGSLSVLVMDNTSIRHDPEILELANHFGVRIEFLPPYSPDLNPKTSRCQAYMTGE